MLYLVRSEDMLSRETGIVYSPDMRSVFYTQKKAAFISGMNLIGIGFFSP